MKTNQVTATLKVTVTFPAVRGKSRRTAFLYLPGSQLGDAARTPFSHHLKPRRSIPGHSAFPADQNDVEQTTRKPMLLLKLSGSFLLRYEQRALFRLLFHEPPRTTRASS